MFVFHLRGTHLVDLDGYICPVCVCGFERINNVEASSKFVFIYNYPGVLPILVNLLVRNGTGSTIERPLRGRSSEVPLKKVPTVVERGELGSY